MAKSRKFTILSEGIIEEGIRPRDIKLETIRGRFGKCEVEDAAENLLKFFQIKNKWLSFSFKDLSTYCEQIGFDPDMMLFGLICPWIDDAMFFGGLRESQNFIIMNTDGSLSITSNFINKILGK